MLRRLLICTTLLTGLLAQNENSQAIKNGETLKITVYREPDFTRTVIVKSDGNVSFPLISDVKAEGLSVAQFTEALRLALSVYIKDPQVVTERAAPK